MVKKLYLSLDAKRSPTSCLTEFKIAGVSGCDENNQQTLNSKF